MTSTPPPCHPGTSEGSGASPVVAATGVLPARGRLGRRAGGPVPASAYWRGWPEVRTDLRASAGLALVMALVGAPAGLLWWALAPRADFRITGGGPEVVGTPSDELLVGDDVIFVLVLAVTGLLLGAGAWFLRRRRGVATVFALAVGASVTGVVAWQVGELLGAGPTEAQLADVGSTVTTSLALGSPAAIAVAPFMAILAYVLAVLHAPGDDLGRADAASATPTEPSQPADAGVAPHRALVDVPPPPRP